mgnify:FL=1
MDRTESRGHLTQIHRIHKITLHTLHKALSQPRYQNSRKNPILQTMRAREEKGDK